MPLLLAEADIATEVLLLFKGVEILLLFFRGRGDDACGNAFIPRVMKALIATNEIRKSEFMLVESVEDVVMKKKEKHVDARDINRISRRVLNYISL